MLTKLKEQLKKLTSSKDFKETGYLCSAFVMCAPSEINRQNWQFDFYDRKKDKITSYHVEPEIKKINIEQDVFKEEKTEVNELKIEKDFITFKKIYELAINTLKKENETPNKLIILLQQLEQPTWNLTFVTDSFKLINIKIDAVTSKILENKKIDLLNWEN